MAILYFHNREQVPITGRWRTNFGDEPRNRSDDESRDIKARIEKSIAATGHAILPESDPTVVMVASSSRQALASE